MRRPTPHTMTNERTEGPQLPTTWLSVFLLWF